MVRKKAPLSKKEFVESQGHETFQFQRAYEEVGNRGLNSLSSKACHQNP